MGSQNPWVQQPGEDASTWALRFNAMQKMRKGETLAGDQVVAAAEEEARKRAEAQAAIDAQYNAAEMAAQEAGQPTFLWQGHQATTRSKAATPWNTQKPAAAATETKPSGPVDLTKTLDQAVSDLQTKGADATVWEEMPATPLLGARNVGGTSYFTNYVDDKVEPVTEGPVNSIDRWRSNALARQAADEQAGKPKSPFAIRADAGGYGKGAFTPSQKVTNYRGTSDEFSAALDQNSPLMQELMRERRKGYVADLAEEGARRIQGAQADLIEGQANKANRTPEQDQQMQLQYLQRAEEQAAAQYGVKPEELQKMREEMIDSAAHAMAQNWLKSPAGRKVKETDPAYQTQLELYRRNLQYRSIQNLRDLLGQYGNAAIAAAAMRNPMWGLGGGQSTGGI